MPSSLEIVGGQPGGAALRQFLEIGHNEDGTTVGTLWTPKDSGFVTYAFDPALISTGSSATSGTAFFTALPVRSPATVSKLWAYVNTAAVTPTANENFLGLYQQVGGVANLLAATTAGALDSLITSGGVFSASITPQSIDTGIYYVGMLFNAATAPVIGRTSGTTGGNANLAAASARFFSNTTGNTSLPASIALASNNPNSNFWAGLS